MAVFNLYQQLQQSKSKQNEEITDVLDKFLQQIKSENERLERRLTTNRTPIEKPLYDPAEKIHVTRNLEQSIYDDKQINNKQRNQYNPYKIQEERLTQHDQIETSLESQVMSLHEQGYSYDKIAKQLNRGKTEIELMIKMNQLKN